MSKAQDHKRVTRRRVFYIPGFDPFPPRRYRELYRRESADQARIQGYEIAQTPLTGDWFGWQVTAQMDGVQTLSDIQVLVWSDIVRRSMGAGIASTYWQLLRTAWVYIGSGAIFHLVRLRKGPVIAAFYPVVLLMAQLFAALVLVWLGAKVPQWAGFDGVAPWIGAAVGAVVGIALLRFFRRIDGKIFAYYLMHDFAFAARWRGANPPELEARMAQFRAAIRAAMDEDIDEVLVVGHSSGAHLAISVLADLIRAGDLPARGPALSFLSIGQAIPMMSFLPKASRLRGDLAFLSATDRLFWLDVSAPGDGCSFALCDPAGVSGVAPQGQTGPLIISAAFTKTLSPTRWKALKRRYFRLHFQYLCAFDRPGDYDYFQITAGPQTLAARFAGRAPTPSRIDRPLSPYRSVAP